MTIQNLKDADVIQQAIDKAKNDPVRPLVVINCITYNHAPYIAQCLEGFVMQKTNFPFVALVHDDASPDGTAEVLREYAEKYPDIIKPICDPTNRYSDKSLDLIMSEWINAYSPKYIAMCEGDDYWIDPLKLQKQVDFMEANPDYSLCFHNAFYLMYESRKVCIFVDKYCSDIDISVRDAILNWTAPTASMLYRSKLFQGFPNELTRIYSGDYSLFLILFARGKVRYIDQIMSVYRRVEKGITSTVDMKFAYSEHIRFLESYDLFTKGRYNGIITERILFLKDLITYIDIRNNHKYHKLVLIIPFLLRKLINK